MPRSRLPMLLVLTLLGLAGANTAHAVALPPGLPILVHTAEDQAVVRAATDLARDLATVTGVASSIVQDRRAIAGRPAIVITTPAHATGQETDASLTGAEAHAAWLDEADSFPRIVLTGTDVRGAIYAVYTFADEILDVPPLWFWASWQPARRSAIEVPTGWRRRFAAPHVRWRAAFPNNTDFLRGWSRTTGADLTEAVYETLLRLKMNTIDVGENLLDAKGRVTGAILAAKARGLAVTSPFLGSFRDWPQGVIYASQVLRLDNIAGLEEFWSARINALQAARIEMVWGIGFRGTSDTGFASSFPDAPSSPELQGEIIARMLERQLVLLRQLTGSTQLRVRTEIFSELIPLFAQGAFRPPADPDLIWQFSNEGRDHYPGDELLHWQAPPQPRVGYYLHLQFTSTGSHYAEGEGPWKMARNVRLAEETIGAPLLITKVNIGNLREFGLSLSAHAAGVWAGPGAPVDTIMEDLFERYFGANGAPVGRLYRALLESYWQQRHGTLPEFARQFIFHDLRLGAAIARLLTLVERDAHRSEPFDPERFRIHPPDNGVATQLEAVAQGTEWSADRRVALLAAAESLRTALSPEQQPLFDDVIVRPTRLLLALDRATAALARLAMLPEPRFPAGSDALRVAVSALQDAVAALSSGEQGRFAGWYANLEILDLRGLLQRAEQAALDRL